MFIFSLGKLFLFYNKELLVKDTMSRNYVGVYYKHFFLPCVNL